jgi:hypothetical protein
MLGWSDFKPENVVIAASENQDFYMPYGIVIGGNRSVDNAVVRSVHWDSHDSIVIEVGKNNAGTISSLEALPYFHVGLERTYIMVSIWNVVHDFLNLNQLNQLLSPDSKVRNAVCLPKLEDRFWSIVFYIKDTVLFQVSELKNPARILIKLKNK